MKKKLLLVGIAFALLAGWGWPLHVLGLRDSLTGRWVFASVVHPGDTFALGYTHSVKRKPVWDFYTVDEHYHIIETKVIYPGSGFGLPSGAQRDEIHSLLADGNECISGMHRLIPFALLRIERAYNDLFTFRETLTLNLSQILGDCVVDLRIHRSNPIQFTFQLVSSYGERLWDTRQSSKSNN